MGVHHVGVAPAEQRMHRLDRVGPAPPRSIAMGRGIEIRLEDRLQHKLGGALHHAVPNCRNPEWSLAATRLRDHYPPHRCRPVRLRDELVSDLGEPLLQPRRLDHRERDPVHTWCACVRTGKLIGVGQDVLAINLVVEQIEAVRRFRLRLAIQLPLKPPDAIWCSQAHRQSPILASVGSAPEVRVLPSAGIARPLQYHDPVRPPREPPPYATLKTQAPPPRVSPDYPNHPSGVPCPLPRRIVTVHMSVAYRRARPSPYLRRVGIRNFTFEACSGFTHVTARQIAQPPQGGICRKASAQRVAPQAACQLPDQTDYYLGGIFLHW